LVIVWFGDLKKIHFGKKQLKKDFKL